jgi:tRNA1Val (adenine37-N6)-methyltransferase
MPSNPIEINSVTSSCFLNGKIQVAQPENGYRFSIDSVILAGFSNPPVGATVVDLGTGCGIIPLILAHRALNLRLIGVELQPSLAAMASKNIKQNGLSDQISILCQDMSHLSKDTLGTTVDYVISNPPYYPVLSGRINPNPQKALARHELAVNLSKLVTIARKILHKGGRFILIYPSKRLTDVLLQMRKKGIEPKILHMIFSKQNESAKLVIIEGVRDGRPGIKEISSLIVYRLDGQYTPEMIQLLKRTFGAM